MVTVVNIVDGYMASLTPIMKIPILETNPNKSNLALYKHLIHCNSR